MSFAATLTGLATILATFPWPRCTPIAATQIDASSPSTGKVQSTQRAEEVVGARVSPGTGSGSARPPASDVRLDDDVVLRGLDQLQPAFLRCFERAQRMDGVGRVDVQLHLQVDAAGAVVAASNDAINDRLRTCVTAVARKLSFDAPGRSVSVDVPLMFR